MLKGTGAKKDLDRQISCVDELEAPRDESVILRDLPRQLAFHVIPGLRFRDSRDQLWVVTFSLMGSDSHRSDVIDVAALSRPVFFHRLVSFSARIVFFLTQWSSLPLGTWTRALKSIPYGLFRNGEKERCCNSSRCPEAYPPHIRSSHEPQSKI